MPDSSKFYRFYRLDSVESIFFRITYEKSYVTYGITLKRNFGLQVLVVQSTFTSEEAPAAYDRLLTQTITTVGQYLPQTLPMSIRLGQNYPNPFNPTTTISFSLPHRSHVSLIVYNLLGMKVQTLIEGDGLPGSHNVVFDGAGLASGVYYYRLQAGEYRETKKLLLVR